MEEKLKIIEAMDTYLPDVDGVINCVHNYCLNLYKKADISVMVPRNKKSYTDNQPYKIHRCKSMNVPVLNNYYGFPKSDKKFKKEMDAVQADIIHFNSPFNMGNYAVSLAKKKNIPVVATFHSNMRPIFKSIVKFDGLTEMMVKSVGRCYKKCDEVFVCSPLVEKQLRSFGYTGKVTYLPFGTDLPRCENVDELRVQANKEFGIEENELVLLYVGRIMKLKRIDFILKSLKLVKDRGIKFKFYVVGKGPDLKKLKSLAKKLGFTEKEVIFTGFISRELFPLINARADLLCFPSLYDNFGLVKVEAAAYNTAGVFINNSCAGYGVTDGVNGYLSENTAQDFAEKIIQAVSDRDKLREVGENASRDLYISWSDCSDLLLKRLTEIVKEHKEKEMSKNAKNNKNEE